MANENSKDKINIDTKIKTTTTKVSAPTTSKPSVAPSGPFEPVSPAPAASPTPGAGSGLNQPQGETSSGPEPVKKPAPETSVTEEPSATPSKPEPQTPSQTAETNPNTQPQTKPQTEKPQESFGSPQLDKAAKEGDLNKKVDLGKPTKEGAKNTKGGKEGLKEKGKEAIKDKGKQAANQFTKKATQAVMRAIKQLVASAATWLTGTVGWPVIIMIVVLVIILIIFSSTFGGAATLGINSGWYGTTLQQLAKPESTEVSNTIKDNQTAAKGTSGTTNATSFHLFDFLDSSDKTFIQEGKADKRLLAALHYLAQKHNRIAVSHIISAYKDMPTDPESGSQLGKNVSAHKNGLAADISQIDFVYKALEPSQICNGADGSPPLNDKVYYADGLPTTNVSDISSVNASGNFNDTGSSLQSTSETLNKVNTSNSDVSNKVNGVKNRINELIGGLKSNSTDLGSLRTNITSVNNNITKAHDAINKSDLPKEQKDSLNKKLNTLSQQLSTASYKYIQLDNLAFEEQKLINQLTANLQNDANALAGEISAVNKQIDAINQQLNKLASFQNISVLRDLGKLNSSLGDLQNKIGAVINGGSLPELGGSLDAFGGVFGSGSELLRLYCEGGPVSAGGISQKQAIPIKVSWQDSKPDVLHASADQDESLTTDPRVFYVVYQPQARVKVHQVISELLQFPYDMKDTTQYKVHQLITFSKERDVTPFATILDKLYDAVRPGNYGLFDMPESWAQVHVGY